MAAGSRDSPVIPFYLVVVVWGERYVTTFLRIALPFFLSPRNLPGLGNRASSRFILVTTAEDRRRIEGSAIYRLLRETLEVVFIEPPWLLEDAPYQLRAARAHRLATEMAAADGACCVYLCPDFLLSDGSLQSLERAVRDGKRAVLVTGLRLAAESTLDELERMAVLGPGRPIAMSSRELAALALRNLHEEIRRANWGHPAFSTEANLCTWDVPGETGLLIRAFHLHPLLVAPGVAGDFSKLASSTIDGDFLGSIETDWERIHIESDSDSIAMFSLTPAAERRKPSLRNAASVELLRTAAFGPGMTPLHRFYFSKAIRLHVAALNEGWSAVERGSGMLSYEILRYQGAATALQYVAARDILRELQRRAWRRALKLFDA